jgi:hypothetical protein
MLSKTWPVSMFVVDVPVPRQFKSNPRGKPVKLEKARTLGWSFQKLKLGRFQGRNTVDSRFHYSQFYDNSGFYDKV